MKRSMLVLAALALAAGSLAFATPWSPPPGARDATPLQASAPRDGKQIFLDNGCDGCHGVKAAGIPAQSPEMGAPDLSRVDRDTTFVKAYLEQKAKLDDATHPIRFAGEAAALDTLAAWLVSEK